MKYEVRFKERLTYYILVEADNETEATKQGWDRLLSGDPDKDPFMDVDSEGCDLVSIEPCEEE